MHLRFIYSLLKNNYLWMIFLFMSFMVPVLLLFVVQGDKPIVFLGGNRDNWTLQPVSGLLDFSSKGLISKIIIFIFIPVVSWLFFRRNVDNTRISYLLSYKFSRTMFINLSFISGLLILIIPFIFANIMEHTILFSVAEDGNADIYSRYVLDSISFSLLIICWYSIIWSTLALIPKTSVSLIVIVLVELLFFSNEVLPSILGSSKFVDVFSKFSITRLFEFSYGTTRDITQIKGQEVLNPVNVSVLWKDLTMLILPLPFLYASNFYWFKRMDLSI